MKKKSIFIPGVLAILLVFGLLSCDNGGDKDPVKVDMKLPSVSSLANFTGTFVANEEEAMELVVEVIDEVDLIGYLMGDDMGDDWEDDDPFESITFSRNFARTARAIYSDSNSKEFKNEKITDGIYATGFYEQSYKISAKNAASNDEDDVWDAHYENPAVDDYMEWSMKVKYALTVDNAKQGDIAYHGGKMTADGNRYDKDQIASLEPMKYNYTRKEDASQGIALSISKDGKGLKFVMKLSRKVNSSVKDVAEDDYDFWKTYWETYEEKVTISVTIDVYDNDNAKKFSKTIKNYKEYMEFLYGDD